MDMKFDALNLFACLRPFSQQFNPIWSLFACVSLNIQNEWDYRPLICIRNFHPFYYSKLHNAYYLK